MSAAVGVQLMAERVRLRVDSNSVELTLGEAMRVRDHLSAAIADLADDRSVLPTLEHLLASLPSNPSLLRGPKA